MNIPHHNDNNHSGKKAAFAAALVLVGLLVYAMVQYTDKLPGSADEVSAANHTQDTSPVITTSVKSHEMTLGFRVGGRIERMLANENAAVRKGDLLATMDKAPYEQALNTAKAQLQAAQAQLSPSAQGPVSNFNAIEAARANVETAQYTYESARDELEKRRKLMTSGPYANTLDHVYNDDVRNARDAELDLARARRALAQQEAIGGVRRDPAADKSTVDAAAATVALAESNLAETKLRAPADGMITRIFSGTGATVQANDKVCGFTVMNADGEHP